MCYRLKTGVFPRQKLAETVYFNGLMLKNILWLNLCTIQNTWL